MNTRFVGSALLAFAMLGCADGSDERGEPVMRARARVGSRGNFLGVFQPKTATRRLRMQRPGWNEPAGERTFVFGSSGDTPIVGDWDGDGQQTPGVFRAGAWSLRNALEEGLPTLAFHFGQDGDTPVVGDWDGDGVATVGVFKDGVFSLRNANSDGPAERVELGTTGDVPVAGDWDGDGADSVGIYTPSTGTFALLDANDTGASETTVELGVRDAQPVVGDWDDNRRDTVGARLLADWTLLNDHRTWARTDKAPTHYGSIGERYGLGEIAVEFGEVDSVAVVGNWLPTANRGFAGVGSELREFFPLAADFQLPESFEGWVDAGVNTVIRVRSAADPDAASPKEVDDWTSKANALGLKMIRQARENPAEDNDEPNLLAFLIKDEPDIQPEDPYDELARLAASLRADGIKRRPVFVNFAGWSILRQNDGFYKYGLGDRNGADFYSRYVELEDWASQDIYAISQMYEQQRLSVDDAMATLPLTFDKLRRWAPTKPQFAFIETSQHNGSSLEVSSGHLRAQVWLAIARGVRGIFYFTADGCNGPAAFQTAR